MEVNEKKIFLQGLFKKEAELEAKLAIIRQLIQENSDSDKKSFVLEFKEPTDDKTNSVRPEGLKEATDGEKFLMVLKEHQRFMKVREIAEYLDSQLGGGTQKWITKLSRKTRHLKQLNKIVSIQVGKTKTNFFWGSPNWLESDGNIKEKHKYSATSLSKKRQSSISMFDI